MSELEELSNLSKAYISQVKHGKRPASQRLLEILHEADIKHSYGKSAEVEKAIMQPPLK